MSASLLNLMTTAHVELAAEHLQQGPDVEMALSHLEFAAKYLKLEPTALACGF